MKYVATPYTLTFTPANNNARMKAMQLAVDAAWSIQWHRTDNEREGWVRHCRLHLERGDVDFLVRHYQTKEEKWAIRIDCNKRTEGKFVIQSSSEEDLMEIWKKMSKPRADKFFDIDYLLLGDINGEAVFATKQSTPA